MWCERREGIWGLSSKGENESLKDSFQRCWKKSKMMGVLNVRLAKQKLGHESPWLGHRKIIKRVRLSNLAWYRPKLDWWILGKEIITREMITHSATHKSETHFSSFLLSDRLALESLNQRVKRENISSWERKGHTQICTLKVQKILSYSHPRAAT